MIFVRPDHAPASVATFRDVALQPYSPLDVRFIAVLSVRPKIAELAFHVFGRSLHPELFNVAKSRTISRENYTAQIDITSCGHVVRWNSCLGLITEVASSAHQPLPSTRQHIGRRLKGSRTEQITDHRGISYRTHFQLESVKPDLFWMMHKQLSTGPTEGLLHRFDSNGRMSMGALSYVNVETRLRSTLIQAIHTFPDDHAIVKVESLFSIPAKVKKPELG